jgi:protein required for attachment to host cells
MAATWIVVAHGSAAKIIESQKNGQELTVVKKFTHPATAKKDVEIHSDRPGRSYSSTGSERHAMDPGEEATDHERRIFAKEITDFLEKNFGENKFAGLIITAPPDLLGHFRDSLSDTVKKLIKGELDKDLYSLELKDPELIERIRKDLNLALI